MTKKAIAEETLVKLIAFVFVVGIALIIFFNINELLRGESNKETVHNWVLARGVFKGIITDTPPVNDLDEPLKIEDSDDFLWDGNKPPRAYKEIADSMADCWTAFDKGETDFINAIEKDIFCFPCKGIIFSDEITRGQTKVKGFNNYLNDTHTRGKDSPTYLQFLANDNELVLSQEDLQEDEFLADQNLYVMFFAASGRGITNIITNIVGLGDVVPEPTQETSTYNPAEVTQLGPQHEGFSGSEGAVVGVGTAVGLQAGKYILPRVAESLSGGTSALTTTTTTTQAAEQLVLRTAALEIAPDGTRRLTMQIATRTATQTVTTAAAKEAAEKAVGKAVAKGFAKAGAKVLAGPIGWGLTIASAGYGVYNIIWGEKPFVAKVMIVEAGKVDQLCNE